MSCESIFRRIDLRNASPLRKTRFAYLCLAEKIIMKSNRALKFRSPCKCRLSFEALETRRLLAVFHPDLVGEITDSDIPSYVGGFGGTVSSVDVDGNVMVVGVKDALDQNYEPHGAAYVFSRASTLDLWIYETTLYSKDQEDSRDFGFSVATSGNAIIVGDPLHFNSQLLSGVGGRVSIFVRNASGYWQLDRFDDGAFGGRLGWSVDIRTTGSSYIAVAGEPAATPNLGGGGPQSGGVRILGPGVNGFQLGLGGNGDGFGTSVSLGDDLLAVGAPGFDQPSATDAGAAYVFANNNGAWALRYRVDGNRAGGATANSGDRAGESVSLDGLTLAIGVPYDNRSFGDDGTVMVFTLGLASAVQSPTLISSDSPNANGRFGSSVIIRGDTLIANELFQVPNFFTRSGSNWVPADDPPPVFDEVTDSFAFSGNSIVYAVRTLNAPVNPPRLKFGFVDTTSTFDFGDTFGFTAGATTFADNGARHVAIGPRLGSGRSVEADRISGFDTFDDGVRFGTLIAGSSDNLMEVDVSNAPQGALLNAWINSPSAPNWIQVAENIQVGNGRNNVRFTIPTNFSLFPELCSIRIRLSSEDGLAVTGPAIDGEVEDYQVQVLRDFTLSVTTQGNNIIIEQTGSSGRDLRIFFADTNLSVYIYNLNSLRIESNSFFHANRRYEVRTTLAGGITIVGSPAQDELVVVGANTLPTSTSARYVSKSSGMGNAHIDLTYSGGFKSFVNFSSIDTLRIGGMLDVSVDGVLAVAGGQFFESTASTPLNLSNITFLSGGSVASPSGLSLGSGESLIGFGSVQGRFSAEAGSYIAASGGSLSLGNASHPAGFFSRGELHVGNSTVNLQDGLQAVLGSYTTLAGGNVNATGGVVDFGNIVAGFGTIGTPNSASVPLVVNGAILGDSAASRITLTGFVKGVGTLSNVNLTGTYSPGLSPASVSAGSLNYAANSTTIIEIAGISAGSQYDQVNHEGDVGISGILNVQLLNGFIPQYGNVFDVMTWSGTRTGQFQGFSGMALNNSTVMVIPKYEQNQLRLITTGPGDANLDGQVTFADFLTLQNAMGQPGDWSQGDFNLDGSITFADFLILQNRFGQTYFTASQAAKVPSSAAPLTKMSTPVMSSTSVLGLVSTPFANRLESPLNIAAQNEEQTAEQLTTDKRVANSASTTVRVVLGSQQLVNKTDVVASKRLSQASRPTSSILPALADAAFADAFEFIRPVRLPR